MDPEELRTVQRWASRGTLHQFASEIEATLSEQEETYQSEIEGNTLTVCRVHKEGGFLGIGAKTIRDPVLQLTLNEDDVVVIDREVTDSDFVHLLAGMLAQH